ncbi:MAG: MFS transporter [Verrucomicrobia bacterium]|nr:MFS transporter [Verrucomicrobiota bacterium]MBI3871083.1 MFS transporter [Verrucomicrobiota bacterium]
MSGAPTSSADATRETALSGLKRWGVLGLLMLLCFISHFNRASITSAGDERIMAQFQISPKAMGQLYSAFLLVYTIFMIPGGWFIDCYGPRVALTCMGLGSALFCAFTGAIGLGFVPSSEVYPALLLVRSIMGLLSTPLHPAAARTVGSVFSRGGEALPNGLITGASILAYAVVHPVFGRAIDRLDWPVAFIVSGALTAAVAVAWCWYSGLALKAHRREAGGEAPPPPRSEATPAGTRARGAGLNLSLLTLSYAAVGYFQYLFFYWLHYYFESVLHWSAEQSRNYAGLPSLAMAVCMPLGGMLSGWWESRSGAAGLAMAPRVGMLLSGLFLLMGIYSTQWGWIVVWFTASLGVLGLCESSFWTMAVRIGGRRAGTAAAIMNTGGNALGLVAPALTPLVGEALGWSWGLGLGVGVVWAGWLCWFGIGARAQGSAPAPSHAPRGS